MCNGVFKQQITALCFVWNETFDQSQKTFIYMYDHISQNSDSTKHSTPTNMFQIYSDYEIFRIIHEETNVCATNIWKKDWNQSSICSIAARYKT